MKDDEMGGRRMYRGERQYLNRLDLLTS